MFCEEKLTRLGSGEPCAGGDTADGHGGQDSVHKSHFRCCLCCKSEMNFLNYRASTDNNLSLGKGVSRIRRGYHDRNHQDEVGEIVYGKRNENRSQFGRDGGGKRQLGWRSKPPKRKSITSLCCRRAWLESGSSLHLGNSGRAQQSLEYGRSQAGHRRLLCPPNSCTLHTAHYTLHRGQ